ncbi:hypothetical protein ACQ4LE_006009 [Meloidogyne hapla]
MNFIGTRTLSRGPLSRDHLVAGHLVARPLSRRPLSRKPFVLFSFFSNSSHLIKVLEILSVVLLVLIQQNCPFSSIRGSKFYRPNRSSAELPTSACGAEPYDVRTASQDVMARIWTKIGGKRIKL